MNRQFGWLLLLDSLFEIMLSVLLEGDFCWNFDETFPSSVEDGKMVHDVPLCSGGLSGCFLKNDISRERHGAETVDTRCGLEGFVPWCVV